MENLLDKFLVNWYAGSIGGIAQVLTGQPFDIVKVRMQNQNKFNPIYANAIHWAKTISAKEGYTAFYKGTMASLSGVGFLTAIQFGLNEVFKGYVTGYNRKKGSPEPEIFTISQYIGWGALTGFANAFISTPVEHIRIRMQMQTYSLLDPSESFNSSFDTLKKIYKKYGFQSLYKGFGITITRDIIAYASFFGTYETLKQKLTKKGEAKNLPLLMVFGSIACVNSWICSYSADVVKTIYQADSLKNPLHKNSRKVWKHLYNLEGLKGFSKGFQPCLVRAALIYPITILVYEGMLKPITQLCVE